MGERAGQIVKPPAAKQSNSNSRVQRTKRLQSINTPLDRILYLQRAIGNQAVQRLIKSGTLQTKLKIGQPGDKYEQEADQVADAVMRMPEPGVQRQVEPEDEERLQSKPLASQITPLVQVQRQEETEEEEETLQAKPLAKEITPSVQRQVEPEEEEKELQAKATLGRISEVNSNFESHIQSLKGGGQPLSENDRAFFEPRFGRDFSQVRLHSNTRAAEAAKAVNARAFTMGRDVVFGGGEYMLGTGQGKRLLAHELMHVMQQKQAILPTANEHERDMTANNPGETEYFGSYSVLQRMVKVDKPKIKIPRPGGKGLDQTNAITVQNYLTTLCSGGNVTVAGTGIVNIKKAFCTLKPLPKGEVGPPTPAPASSSKQPTGCGCLCDLVYSKHQWMIKVDDSSWPHTIFDDSKAANGKKPGGTGGTVTTPSPNSPKLWGASTVSGKALDIKAWLVLGHELCGHGWLANFGLHGPDVATSRGEGGHQETVKRENKLRKEHGIKLRGTFKHPNCGESYWRDKKSPAKVNWSSFRAICQNWRKKYNKKHGTSYKITDRIP